MDYINYSTQIAEGWWQRQRFLHRWWTLYQSDRRWTPPCYRQLRHDLVSQASQHIRRLKPSLLLLEALPRQKRNQSDSYTAFSAASMEQQVAAVVSLHDSRRDDGTAYAALLHCINHEETMERLLGALLEQSAEQGCFRLIVPIGLSPHDLRTGVLCSHFDRTPPLHSPYNPPYIPELIELVMSSFLEMRLYHANVVPNLPVPIGPANIQSIPAQSLTNNLFPLFQSAYLDHPEFAPPDQLEATYLLESWQVTPLTALVAFVEECPVGFTLLQPDSGEAMRQAGGGRNLAWRLWLHWQRQRSANAGRILAGAVLPEWRGRGIGRQLWQTAMHFAADRGWRSVTVGPVIEDSPGADFLGAMGAKPEQHYRLYRSEE